MRVLICDDDDVLRKVVGGVAQAAGHEVVAETDNSRDALELVERLVPEIVVLDLALAYGTGTELMAALRADGTASRILVFSAFAGDRAMLLDSGATAVVEKPDFDGLEQVLKAWAKQATPAGRERRRDRTPRLLPGSTARSPGGLEPDREFYAALGATVAGDALLVLWIEPYGLIVGRDGAHVAADWLMELARITAARSAPRTGWRASTAAASTCCSSAGARRVRRESASESKGRGARSRRTTSSGRRSRCVRTTSAWSSSSTGPRPHPPDRIYAVILGGCVPAPHRRPACWRTLGRVA